MSTRERVLRAGGRTGLVVVAGSALWLVRPGVVENGLRSPRAWITVVAVLLAARLTRLLAVRIGGRPRLGSVLSGVVVATAAVVLLLPSFQQRTLDEPFPTALAELVGEAPAAVVTAPSPEVRSTQGTAPPSAPAADPSPAARPPAPALVQAAPPAPAAPSARAAAPAQAGPAAPVTPSRPASSPPPAPSPSPAAASREVSAAPLEGVRHRASGRTAFYAAEGGAVLRFENVDIEGTPGPVVYLVPRGQRTPEAGVELGPLKAERGSFGYTLPAGVDPEGGWTVLVWCRPYATPIAVADH